MTTDSESSVLQGLQCLGSAQVGYFGIKGNSLLFPGQGVLDAFAGFRRERGRGGSVLAFQSLGVVADSFPDEEELLPIPPAVLAHQEM